MAEENTIREALYDGTSLIGSSANRKEVVNLLKSVEGFGADVFSTVLYKAIGDSSINVVEKNPDGSISTLTEIYINFDSNSGMTLTSDTFEVCELCETLEEGEPVPTTESEIADIGYTTGIYTQYCTDMATQDRTELEVDNLEALYEFLEELAI